MLEKALLDITRRAALRGRGAAAKAVPSATRTHPRHGVAATAGQVHAERQHRLQAEQTHQHVRLLEKVDTDYESATRQALLEHQLSCMGSQQDGGTVTQQDLSDKLQWLPFSYALEATGVLLRAGRVDEALQLITSWHDDVGGAPLSLKPLSLKAKVRASKELRSTIRTLVELKDAQTLRVVADMLEASLKEQRALAGASADSPAFVGCSVENKVARSTYKLTTALGPRRTYAALITAVDALCRLTPEDGVLVSEKVAWLTKASRALSSPSPSPSSSPAVIPFPLQRSFSEAVETDPMYTEELARHVNPRFPTLFRHPTELDAQTIVSLTRGEIDSIMSELKEDGVAKPGERRSGLLSLVTRFLPRSQALRMAERNMALLSCLASPSTASASGSPSLAKSARAAVVSSLRSRNRAERKAMSAALLRRPHLLPSLHLSPTAVLATYGESFYSVSQVNATLSRLSLKAIPTLVRRGREVDAAKLAWNHLSAPCPTTVQLLRRHPCAMDALATALCRTMRATQGQRRETWMARRSLALLRVAAAAEVVTPMHVMVICACSLDKGAPFAAVNEAVAEIYNPSKDARNAEMARWVLNCIRICAQSQDELVRVRLARRSLPGRVAALLRSWCAPGSAAADCSSSAAPVPFASASVPNRSKQLALWSLANDPKLNPQLLALTAALFVDPVARDAFLNCDGLVEQVAEGDRVGERVRGGRQQEAALVDGAASLAGRFHAWEVAASIASNCTNDYTYEQLVRSLGCRPALATAPSTERNLDERPRLHKLLQTELDNFEEKAPLPEGISHVHG